MDIQKLIGEINARTEAATPGPWTICLGSGNIVCAAIEYDNLETGGTMFIADCLPDYCLASFQISDMLFPTVSTGS